MALLQCPVRYELHKPSPEIGQARTPVMGARTRDTGNRAKRRLSAASQATTTREDSSSFDGAPYVTVWSRRLELPSAVPPETKDQRDAR